MSALPFKSADSNHENLGIRCGTEPISHKNPRVSDISHEFPIEYSHKMLIKNCPHILPFGKQT